ncbi:unnamed protein product [Fusarium graminearum]|uniref:Uncharacterized protein n=1 Tax=Gibberella zeae TaxID=5518 RepID=A0A9N8WZ55_GIBZA|nr:unnamed protein product [Fusarium graminearum]
MSRHYRLIGYPGLSILGSLYTYRVSRILRLCYYMYYYKVGIIIEKKKAAQLSNFCSNNSYISSINTSRFYSFKNKLSLTSYFQIIKQLLRQDKAVKERETLSYNKKDNRIATRDYNKHNAKLKYRIYKFYILLIYQTIRSRPFRSTILSFYTIFS